MNPSIIVWTAANGDKFAAENVGTPQRPRVIYAAVTETTPRYHRGEFRDAYPATAEELKAAVEARHNARDTTPPLDGLSWIEKIELEQVAREQRPVERDFNRYISYPERCQLTDEQRGQLYDLLTKGTRASTREAIARALRHPERLPSKGIFNRLMVEPRVWYCAGQDYPSEIRTIRELLKNY